MQLAISEINDYDKCAYILCTKGDTFFSLMSVLDEMPEKKYIFIDEASCMRDFINSSAVLSDYYLSRRNRIVISGTDSLSFSLAARDELYDRMEMIHTSYISYREFYMGKTKKTDDSLYINAAEFLRNDREYLERLMDGLDSPDAKRRRTEKS